MGKREFDPDSGDELQCEIKPDISPDIKPEVLPAPSSRRAWTAAERQLLLELVVEKGKSEAFKTFPGRNKNQCEKAWK